jgi:pentatricopeptide repeat protein
MNKALKLMGSMKQDGISPDIITYSCFIDGNAKQQDMNKALKLMESMKQDGIPPDVRNYNIVISGHMRLNEIDQALRVFDIFLRNCTPGDVTHYLAQDAQRKLEELELDSQVKNAYKATLTRIFPTRKHHHLSTSNH